jgi:hypothetical protein
VFLVLDGVGNPREAQARALPGFENVPAFFLPLAVEAAAPPLRVQALKSLSLLRAHVPRHREQFLIVNVAASSEAVIQGIVAKPLQHNTMAPG